MKKSIRQRIGIYWLRRNCVIDLHRVTGQINTKTISNKILAIELDLIISGCFLWTVIICDGQVSIEETLPMTRGDLCSLVYTKHFCDIVMIGLKVGDNAKFEHALC